LTSYIKRYAYSNARTEDLWAVLEENTGEPVKNLMMTWTKQQGYPVINAKLKGTYLLIEQVFTKYCPFCLFFAFIDM
jgi:puromycin-sensitive aminopeptidase